MTSDKSIKKKRKTQLDIMDLRLLQAIQVSRSVSKAAHLVGLSQPSVSSRLARLRSHFDDLLFVRTSVGMQPTARAMSLMEPLRQALGLFDGTIGQQAPYDPATSKQLFRISMTNVGQLTALPQLLEYLATAAPGIRLDVIELDSNTPQALEAGECDLAVGVTLDAKAGFYRQTLFDEHYLCMVNAKHPRVGRRLTLKRFTEEAHVAVYAEGTSQVLLDKALESAGVERRVCLRVPSFLGLAQMVTHSELLALVPAHLGKVLARSHVVKLLELPIPLRAYKVNQFWHARQHRNPAVQWLRGVLVDLLRD